jgi:hypothetical protein
MMAVVQAFSEAFGADAETESLKIITILSGAGLLVSLLWVLLYLTYGLDLSPSFF